MAKHGATSDDPVFVDAAGRRHRVLAVLGAAAGVLAVVAIVTITIGLIGGARDALPIYRTDHIRRRPGSSRAFRQDRDSRPHYRRLQPARGHRAHPPL